MKNSIHFYRLKQACYHLPIYLSKSYFLIFCLLFFITCSVLLFKITTATTTMEHRYIYVEFEEETGFNIDNIVVDLFINWSPTNKLNIKQGLFMSCIMSDSSYYKIKPEEYKAIKKNNPTQTFNSKLKYKIYASNTFYPDTLFSNKKHLKLEDAMYLPDGDYVETIYYNKDTLQSRAIATGITGNIFSLDKNSWLGGSPYICYYVEFKNIRAKTIQYGLFLSDAPDMKSFMPKDSLCLHPMNYIDIYPTPKSRSPYHAFFNSKEVFDGLSVIVEDLSIKKRNEIRNYFFTLLLGIFISIIFDIIIRLLHNWKTTIISKDNNTKKNK